MTDLRRSRLELDDGDGRAVARVAHGACDVRLVDLQIAGDDLEHVETDERADGEEGGPLGRVGDGNDAVLDAFVESLATQVLRAVAVGHGTGHVDERLALLPDFQGVDYGEGLGVDDVDRVAVLVHRVHACVVGAPPDAVRLDATGSDGLHEDRDRAGRVLPVDHGCVQPAAGDEGVLSAVDDGEVRMVGFQAGIDDGDDGARRQVDDGGLAGFLMRHPHGLAVGGHHHVGGELVGEAGDGVDDLALLHVDDVQRRRENVVDVCGLAVGAEQHLARALGGRLDPPDDPAFQPIDDIHELGAAARDPDGAVVVGEETLVRGAVDGRLGHDAVVERADDGEGVGRRGDGVDVFPIEREAEAVAVDDLEVLGGEDVGQSRGSETDGAEHFVGEGFDDGDGVGSLVAGVDPVVGPDGWSSGQSGSLDLGDGADDEQGTCDCPE